MKVIFNALEVHYTEGVFCLNHSLPTFQVTVFMADFYDFPNDTYDRDRSKVKGLKKITNVMLRCKEEMPLKQRYPSSNECT